MAKRLTKGDAARARALYETDATVTAAEIARTFGVSRQAIEARARREGWQRATRETLDVAARLTADPETRAGAWSGNREPEQLARIIRTYALTGNRGLAAQAGGISADTLARWLKEQPEFAAEMQRARAVNLGDWAEHVHHAAISDWRAARWLIETSPELRDQYAPPQREQKGGPAIHITLNVPRTPEEAERLTTIDATALPKP